MQYCKRALHVSVLFRVHSRALAITHDHSGFLMGFVVYFVFSFCLPGSFLFCTWKYINSAVVLLCFIQLCDLSVKMDALKGAAKETAQKAVDEVHISFLQIQMLLRAIGVKFHQLFCSCFCDCFIFGHASVALCFSFPCPNSPQHRRPCNIFFVFLSICLLCIKLAPRGIERKASSGLPMLLRLLAIP